jgi:hypothetical protein
LVAVSIFPAEKIYNRDVPSYDEPGIKRKNMSREDEIRIIAYGLWEKEGYPDGKDVAHWFKATQIWEDAHKTGPAPISTQSGPQIPDKQAKKAKPQVRR